MTRRLSLEEFAAEAAEAPAPEPAPAPPEPVADLEALRLESYETGYKCGWDDCRAEQAKSESAVASDLAQNLRDLGFTYHEARGDVLAALRPALEAIVVQVLPKIAAEGLAAAVASELMPALEGATELDCELVAAPETIPALEHLVENLGAVDLSLRPEPAYSEAQVSIRMGAETREIDLSRAVAEIGAEFRAFTERLLAETSGAVLKGAMA